LKNPRLHRRENLEIRHAMAILTITSATKVYNKGTQMKINQKRIFLSYGNLHFTGSWRLGKFKTQRIYNVFILDELINITLVSSINHHYIDKQPKMFTSEGMCAICLTNTNESNVFY